MTDPQTQPRRRVLSGMRPTGRLHLGNYMGALYNWVQLQHQFDCFFFIADLHALTTDYADTSRLRENVYQVALDFLSAGLDPSLCTIFIQSHVTQHAELHLLMSMFTPVSLLEGIPSYKDQQVQLREKDLATYGFLGYPLLQSADILLYQPQFVPVGQDQAAHVELTRDLARRFNQMYAPKRLIDPASNSLAEEPDPEKLILLEPQVLLTPSPKLPGIDGRKMSKSYGNSILLSDHPSSILEKMSRMTNGGQRNPQSEPGNPDFCPVGDMHALFSEPFVNEDTRRRCRTAEILCSICKEVAASSIIVHLDPIRTRRKALEANPRQVWSLLETGSQAAAKRAEDTMNQVRPVMGLARTMPQASLPTRSYSTEATRQGHDLTAQAEWWNLPQTLRAKNIKDYWLATIVPLDVSLKQDSERVFISAKKKRIYVTTSCQGAYRLGAFAFEAKPKTYELLALLCWDDTYVLHDFIVPQSAYVGPWSAARKANKEAEITFWVTRSEESFYLHFEGNEPIDITPFRGQYKPLT